MEAARLAVQVAMVAEATAWEEAGSGAGALAALIHLGTSVPGRMGKKAGALRNNVKKLEHVLYELSLLKGTGRRTLAAEKSAPLFVATKIERMFTKLNLAIFSSMTRSGLRSSAVRVRACSQGPSSQSEKPRDGLLQ